MKYFYLLILGLVLPLHAKEIPVGDTPECRKNIAELMVAFEESIAIRAMDRAEMLVFLRERVIEEGAHGTLKYLDQELVAAVMDVLLNEQYNKEQVNRIIEIKKNFIDYPLQAQSSDIKKFRDKLSEVSKKITSR